MPFSYAQYTGNGSTTTFSVPFPFLLKAHVKLYTGFNILTGAFTSQLVDGVGYTWTSGTQVQTTAAPAAGVVLTVIRDTPDSAQLSPWQDGSNLIADDLNTSDLQNLYVVQEQQDRNDAGVGQSTAAITAANAATAASTAATSTANTALSTANTALSNANAAANTASTASSNASAAVSTASTASSNASAAVTTANTANTTANTASSNASSAVTTANAATATANTALSTANTASSNASTALSTANTASTNASNAVTTANTASTNASNAVTTANTASTNASSAVTTANTALSTASTASSNASTALSTANSAAAAVASAVIYAPVANLTALAALSPADGDYFELADSTGAESSSSVSGVPAGLVGAAGLTFRLRYDDPPDEFAFLAYFANDSETRYLKTGTGTVTSTNILDGTIVNADINASAAIVDTKLATIATAGKVSNSATTATNANTASAIVARDASGNFTAGTITAALTGAASSNVLKAGDTMTGALVVPLASAATPSLTFTGDLNTGVFSPGADQVAISTNAVERVEFGTGEVVFNDGGENYDFRIEGDTNANLFFVDASTDRVGLGTSTPQAQLSVIGPVGTLNDSGGTLLLATDAAGTDVQGTLGAGVTFAQRFTSDPGVVRVAGIYGVKGTGTGNFGGSLAFYTQPNSGADMGERLRITTAGNVGIGTTGPRFNLSLGTDVSTSTATPNTIDLGGTFSNTAGQNLKLRLYWDANSTVAGLGVSATSVDYVTFADSAHTFYAGTTERARIDSSGRLLVGTSTSAINGVSQYARLQVVGNTNGAQEWGQLALLRSEAATDISVDETVGGVVFGDSSGNEFGRILCIADANAGSGDYPGRLVFSVTRDGSSSPTEALRISNTGQTTASSDQNIEQFIFDNTNASLASSIIVADSSRAASNAYFFFAGASGNRTDNEFLLRGDGNGLCDGSWTGGGADYAEYFEWSDGNPNEEDRRGISVVLDGDQIRPAEEGEDPIGVISGNPSVVGDAAWNKWSGKYLRDDYGTYIQEDYEVEDEDGNTVIQQRRKLNPAYDPDQEYVRREQRPEWDCVGLMGKLRLCKGQPTGSRWIKMRDISDSVEEWLVR